MTALARFNRAREEYALAANLLRAADSYGASAATLQALTARAQHTMAALHDAATALDATT